MYEMSHLHFLTGQSFEQLGSFGRHIEILVQLQACSKRFVHLQKCQTSWYTGQV